MIDQVFAAFPRIEVFSRILLQRFPIIKSRIKSKYKRGKVLEKKEFCLEKWINYQNIVREVVKKDSIILIHSSMDGLNSLGVSVEQVLDFLFSLLELGCTIVLPAYAASSAKVENGRIKTYDPQKSPCWTGMLPNYFIRKPGVVRTAFPYNSLAAIGPHTENMMLDNQIQDTVYGDYSAWKYCVDNHAQILFLGTTSNDANTIQSHMIADVMKDDWPIEDWYQTIVGPVKMNGKVTEICFKLQKDTWYKYVADRHITKKLIKKGILHCETIHDCPFEYINDSKEMVDYLVYLAKKGDLSYIVPKKYKK